MSTETVKDIVEAVTSGNSSKAQELVNEELTTRKNALTEEAKIYISTSLLSEVEDEMDDDEDNVDDDDKKKADKEDKKGDGEKDNKDKDEDED
ncbi:MAG: hypothetical protein KAS32_24165 [Candidatus Peribacteraceae bacterium]|nr:hypothetical protein [Candidatus Peribacteraceae bacterium]